MCRPREIYLEAKKDSERGITWKEMDVVELEKTTHLGFLFFGQNPLRLEMRLNELSIGKGCRSN